MTASLSRRDLAVLVAVPLVLRAALVPWVPDFEADAYARMEIAAAIADAWRHGRPLAPALYVPVWPPAWHLLCAAVERLVADVYYVPKLLAALFGGLTPPLVYALARRVTPRPRVAWLAWGLVTVAPLHVLYSTSGMTEAFYGFWFTLAALCLLRAERDNSWLVAAAAALGPAALTRFDGWILLVALVPLARWQRRARPSTALVALGVAGLGPLAWLALDWHVAGRPLAFLGAHRQYVEHFYTAFKYADLYADRGFVGNAWHLGILLGTMGPGFAIAGVIGAVRATRGSHGNRGSDGGGEGNRGSDGGGNRSSDGNGDGNRGSDGERSNDEQRAARALAAWLLIAFAYLVALWLLRRQVGWRRHYLAIGCALGPFTALALAGLARRWRLAVVALDVGLVLARSLPYFALPRAYAEAAAFVRARPGVVYCDEPGVRVMARLPPERLARDAPRATPAAMLAWLRAHQVSWVVYSEVDYTPLGDAFPWMRAGGAAAPLPLAFDPPANRRLLPRLAVYHLDP